MRQVYSLLIMCRLAIGGYAQTQQGVVKTKGRMVNGTHVAGKGLSGATVTIQGRNAVQSQTNGDFSFPVSAKTFTVQGVQKKGYQLVDPDAMRKAYQYSPNTFYVVMEKPEQQAEDKLAIERKIRRTLQQQLQQREDELEDLKAQNKLTQEEYLKAMQQLYDDQKNNEKLIADMVKEYSEIDYDQLDEFNRLISEAILNGELTKADSLLRTKGDMNSRDTEITRRLEAEAQEEQELAQREQKLKISKEGTRKLLEDFATDCYNYYNMYKLENKYDSAAYYIELRANRDTINATWQFDAALYCYKQNLFDKAIKYLKRALIVFRRLAETNPQENEPEVARTLNILANIYNKTQRFKESENMYYESLEIRRRLASSNPQTFEPDVAYTLNDLAILYYITKRFTESEVAYKEAMDIYRRLAIDNPQTFEPDLAKVLNNLANLCSDTKRFTESETLYKEALEIRRRLAVDNPRFYEPEVASTLNNLANLFIKTQHYAESEVMYKDALEIYHRLATDNSQAFEPYFANTLNNLALLYSYTQRFTESETMYMEALEIRKRLAASYPLAYEPNVSQTYSGMSFLYILMKNFSKAEQYARDGLSLSPTQHLVATNLAAALLFQGKYAGAEQIYRQYKDELKDSFLDDFKQFAEAGVIPEELKEDVERIKRMLNEP